MKDIILNIDNREVHVSQVIIASCGDYTVFDGQIWFVYSTSGAGKDFQYFLEREKENIRHFPPKNTRLYKVMKPTGHISI